MGTTYTHGEGELLCKRDGSNTHAYQEKIDKYQKNEYNWLCTNDTSG